MYSAIVLTINLLHIFCIILNRETHFHRENLYYSVNLCFTASSPDRCSGSSELSVYSDVTVLHETYISTVAVVTFLSRRSL
jgi:hypothetical protein